MKIRIDDDTYAQLGTVAYAIGVSRAEVVRRCLRHWQKCGGGVVPAQFRTPTTRTDSEAYEMDLSGFYGLPAAQNIVAVVRWRLAQIEWPSLVETCTTLKRLESQRKAMEREAQRMLLMLGSVGE